MSTFQATTTLKPTEAEAGAEAEAEEAGGVSKTLRADTLPYPAGQSTWDTARCKAL